MVFNVALLSAEYDNTLVPFFLSAINACMQIKFSTKMYLIYLLMCAKF